MNEIFQQITTQMGSYMPRVLGALAILIIGWLAAVAIAALVRNLLHRTTLDNRLAGWYSGGEPEGAARKPVDVERGISKGILYLIMLFVLVAAFQALGTTLVTEPINNLLNRVFAFAPQLIGAAVLILIAWVLARVLRMLVARALTAAKFDERLSGKAEMEGKLSLSRTISEAVYWIVLLLFLPAILSTLELSGLLVPVSGMLNKILNFLPNIVTAALILFVGWFVARIVQRIVTSLLEAVGTDRLSVRVGLASVLGGRNLSYIIGMIMYVVILVPIVIAALNALNLQALTVPASRMLEMTLLALPNIFAAVLILAIGFVVGRLVAGFLNSVLVNMGLNALMFRLGLSREAVEGRWTPSAVVGQLAFAGIMLFSVIEASDQLGFGTLSGLIAQFMVLAGHILLGLVIFAIGLVLANLAARAIHTAATPNARLLAVTARVAILALAGAMALRQMGLANEIINLAFGLTLGSIAVAAAIALGLGGRDIAARELNDWVQSIKSKKINVSK